MMRSTRVGCLLAATSVLGWANGAMAQGVSPAPGDAQQVQPNDGSGHPAEVGVGSPQEPAPQTGPATPGSDAPLQSADEAGTPTGDGEVVVTGTRSALENAENFKRKSAVLVDGISADDIGALPDVSIADALVRIPGLTANTQANGFGQVSIRGLGPDLTMTQYNGRPLPTDSNGDRRVDLGSLPTEGIAAAVIQKTPDAATIEGGLAGIIDQEPIHPLESRRRGLTLVVRGIKNEVASKIAGDYYDMMKTGFRGEATYVARPADNLGIALTYSRYQVTNNQIHTTLEVYQPARSTRAITRDGIVDAYPNNVGPIYDYNSQNRDSFLGTVQWDPIPSVRFSADGFYIHNNIRTGPIRLIAVGAAGPAAGSPALATVSTTIENNFATQFQGNVSQYRLNYNNNRNSNTQLLGGFNIAFDDGGPLTFKVDTYYAKVLVNNHARQAQVENDTTNAAGTAAGQTLPFAYDARDTDHVTFNFAPLNSDDYALAQITTNDPRNRDRIKSIRADFTYNADLPLFKSVSFGLKFDNRLKTSHPDNTLYTYGTNLNNRPDLDSSFLTKTPLFPVMSFADQAGGPSATVIPLFDINKLLALRSLPTTIRNTQDGNDIAGRSAVNESTYALYYQVNLQAGRLTGNVGLRYFITDEAVLGFLGTTEANKVRRIVNNDYRYVLPALNLQYSLTDKLAFRFAASKTLSRPTYGNLRIGSAVDFSSFLPGITPIVSVGNPNLSPFTSKNVDLSAEWAPNPYTFIAVQGFYKWVTNFVVNTTYFGPLLNPLTGQTVLAQFNSQANDPTVRHFRGIEIITRRDLNFLPWYFKNLGIAVNYNHNLSDATDQFASVAGFPTRLSTNNFTRDIVNAQLYYSSAGVDLRLAYRYYDRYSRAVDNAYQYTPGGQLDLSGSVHILPNVNLVGTIRNLNNSKDIEFARDGRFPDREVLIYHDTAYSGRQYIFGVRAQF